jgi:hypothetical protein
MSAASGNIRQQVDAASRIDGTSARLFSMTVILRRELAGRR